MNKPLDLPKRVYPKHGALFYVDKQNKWHRLGAEWNREAREQWAKLSSDSPTENTVAELLAAQLSHLASLLAAGKLSPRHYADRQKDAEQLNKFFGRMNKTTVKRKHVALYLTNRTDKHGNHAPVRANREVSFLSSAYRRDVTLDSNPCDGVPRNEETPRDRYVEHWERRQFAKRCCPDWLRAYLLLKYLTGLRMGDMLRLGTENEGARGLIVRIGKSRRRKVLEFGWTRALRAAVGFIHRLGQVDAERNGQGGENNNAVNSQGNSLVESATPQSTHVVYFRTRSGERLSASGFKSAWRRAMQQWRGLGHERFREHDIRGKTGSDSATLAEASARLGHDRTATTARHYRRGTTKVRPLR